MFRILLKINLLTYKTLREKQPVYLHSMLAASIPSCSLRSNNDHSLSVPRVMTNTGARAFRSYAPSFWNNLPLSVRSAISVATFKKYLKIHLFDLAFSHRYRHSPWPADVTELFPQFCCLTLIWLSRYWAWLCRGYWRYRILIDWLMFSTWWLRWAFHVSDFTCLFQCVFLRENVFPSRPNRVHRIPSMDLCHGMLLVGFPEALCVPTSAVTDIYTCKFGISID